MIDLPLGVARRISVTRLAGGPRRLIAMAVVLAMLGAGCAQQPASSPATGSATTPAAAAVDRHRLSNDGKILIGPAGQQLSVGSKGAIGYIDGAARDGDGIVLSGWVALADLSAPAEQVVVVSGDRSVATAPTQPRPDVVEGYDKPSLERSGFRVPIDASSLDCSAGLRAFATTRRTAAPLERLVDVGQVVRDACSR